MNAQRPDSPHVREGPLGVGLRLLAGGISWSRDGLCRLASLETPFGQGAGSRAWYGLLGATAGLGPALRRGVRRGRSRLGTIEQRVMPWLQWIDRELLGSSPSQGLDELRRATHAKWAEWEARGRREELAGRWLALRAAQRGLDLVIFRASKSPALEDAVETASSKIGESALDDVRERGARADDVAESILHRLFRRHGESESHESEQPEEHR